RSVRDESMENDAPSLAGLATHALNRWRHRWTAGWRAAFCSSWGTMGGGADASRESRAAIASWVFEPRAPPVSFRAALVRYTGRGGKTTEWRSSTVGLPAAHQAGRFADCRRLSGRHQHTSGAPGLFGGEAGKDTLTIDTLPAPRVRHEWSVRVQPFTLVTPNRQRRGLARAIEEAIS